MAPTLLRGNSSGDPAPTQTRASTELGAETITRHIPGIGLLEFFNADAGCWRTQKGELAKKPKRVYNLTTHDGDSRELDAVSSVVGCLDKFALRAWYETRGIEGADLAWREGIVTKDTPPEEVPEKVREVYGADRAKKEAADRGTVIHSVFETMALGGEPPDPADFPEQARPWYRGAMNAWLSLQPEPFEVELVTCHPELGYAGRPDLAAIVDAVPTLIDYKSSGKGVVYREAHLQTRLYEMARRACGQTPCERIIIVAVDDSGGFTFSEGLATEEDALALVDVFRCGRRLDQGLTAQRAAVRQALKKAA